MVLGSLECCIDERTSSDIPTCVCFCVSDPYIVENQMHNRSAVQVTSISISRNEQSGLDIECLGTLLDDFESLRRLDFEFAPAHHNVELRMLAQQLSNLSKPDRGVFVNGSFCDGSYITVQYKSPIRAKRTKGDVCLQTKMRIGTHSCSQSIGEHC